MQKILTKFIIKRKWAGYFKNVVCSINKRKADLKCHEGEYIFIFAWIFNAISQTGQTDLSRDFDWQQACCDPCSPLTDESEMLFALVLLRTWFHRDMFLHCSHASCSFAQVVDFLTCNIEVKQQGLGGCLYPLVWVVYYYIWVSQGTRLDYSFKNLPFEGEVCKPLALLNTMAWITFPNRSAILQSHLPSSSNLQQS